MAFFAYLGTFYLGICFNYGKYSHFGINNLDYGKKMGTIKAKSDCGSLWGYCRIPGLGFSLGKNNICNTFSSHCDPDGCIGLSYFMGGHA